VQNENVPDVIRAFILLVGLELIGTGGHGRGTGTQGCKQQYETDKSASAHRQNLVRGHGFPGTRDMKASLAAAGGESPAVRKATRREMAAFARRIPLKSIASPMAIGAKDGAGSGL
jgi:hypothetical protein